eukprot:gnl/MRDRNA2_/MRDRNA2_112712_c0_seq1.p1 gnl/MRDRNA2_/MRDRNA2_112712_c0~~gnl/MRDRNA2_/MRDRNA2_112712_c0_seq1.p1  ORF type:complete len:265 (-),score=91.05 gnl/MRDRNA2_/MRDRNA2_112712_c0_seq1:1-795(-)
MFLGIVLVSLLSYALSRDAKKASKKGCTSQDKVDELWDQWVPKGQKFMRKDTLYQLVPDQNLDDSQWDDICRMVEADPMKGLTKEQFKKIGQFDMDHPDVVKEERERELQEREKERRKQERIEEIKRMDAEELMKKIAKNQLKPHLVDRKAAEKLVSKAGKQAKKLERNGKRDTSAEKKSQEKRDRDGEEDEDEDTSDPSYSYEEDNDDEDEDEEGDDEEEGGDEDENEGDDEEGEEEDEGSGEDEDEGDGKDLHYYGDGDDEL